MNLSARVAPAIEALPEEAKGFLDDLRLRAAVAPAANALVAPGGEAVTFEELSNRIAAAADVVTKSGLSRNDVVAIAMPDGPELLSIILGVSSVGICAPLNPTLHAGE